MGPRNESTMIILVNGVSANFSSKFMYLLLQIKRAPGPHWRWQLMQKLTTCQSFVCSATNEISILHSFTLRPRDHHGRWVCRLSEVWQEPGRTRGKEHLLDMVRWHLRTHSSYTPDRPRSSQSIIPHGCEEGLMRIQPRLGVIGTDGCQWSGSHFSRRGMWPLVSCPCNFRQSQMDSMGYFKRKRGQEGWEGHLDGCQ